NRFFNPVIGLPLACQQGSCEPIAMDNSTYGNDNSRISTTTLFGNIPPEDLEGTGGSDPVFTVDIQDFFIGRSAFTNTGIIEFNYTPPSTFKIGDEGSGLQGNPMTEVRLDASGNMLPPQVLHSFPGDFVPGTDFTYSRISWQLPRETTFRMISGGAYSQSSTGRYSLNIHATRIGDGNGWIFDGSTVGARCAVLINEED